MKDHQIIIAVAKLDGFTQLDNMPNPMFALEVCEYEAACCHTRASEFEYLISRDAIIPVIEKVYRGTNKWSEFERQLEELHGEPCRLIEALTTEPKQLCIALLKATGKWEE